MEAVKPMATTTWAFGPTLSPGRAAQGPRARTDRKRRTAAVLAQNYIAGAEACSSTAARRLARSSSPDTMLSSNTCVGRSHGSMRVAILR